MMEIFYINLKKALPPYHRWNREGESRRMKSLNFEPGSKIETRADGEKNGIKNARSQHREES